MHRTVDQLAARWMPDKTLGEAENRVLTSALKRMPLARDINEHVAAKAGFGDRLADQIARVGGSWNFILGFAAFLAVWVVLNVWLLSRPGAFDPYPFVFLNLILSMLAAVQAPIIMMAQNRQAGRDRIDAAHDYEVNLKAEIEIMALHEKLDEMRHGQIIAMRQTVDEIAARLARMEARLEREG